MKTKIHADSIIYDSPVGFLELGFTKLALVFVKRLSAPLMHGDLAKLDFTGKKLPDIALNTMYQLNKYFSGEQKTFNLTLAIEGTNFQKTVWDTLLSIPYGETKTYKEIASFIGRPRSCRAVGMANRNNPLPIIIPCHRVIGSSGKLTGYSGGLDMKKALLLLEARHK